MIDWTNPPKILDLAITLLARTLAISFIVIAFIIMSPVILIRGLEKLWKTLRNQ